MLASANGSAEAALSIDGGMVINTKTIQAAASGQGSAFVDLESTSGVTNSGTIQALAGADSVAYVDLYGTISNTTSGLIFASGNGVIDLEDGATISGGTLKTSGSQAAILVDDSDAATISGATIASGSFVLAATDGELTLSNGTSLARARPSKRGAAR